LFQTKSSGPCIETSNSSIQPYQSTLTFCNVKAKWNFNQFHAKFSKFWSNRRGEFVFYKLAAVEIIEKLNLFEGLGPAHGEQWPGLVKTVPMPRDTNREQGTLARDASPPGRLAVSRRR
jgi:hypothetical protein